MLTLRVIGPDDWQAWRELRLAALEEAPYAFGSRLADWQGENDREDRWRARLAIPGCRSFIAELDGRPVGMSAGVPGEEPGVAELVSMWVEPAARGHGVGDFLIRAVERWAHESGARELHLAVADGNTAAIALYERNGYTRIDGSTRTMPDGARCEYVLAKAL